MRIDHVAHPTRNPQETHRFYTEVLGLELVQAYPGRDLLLIYALPDGGSLAFSTAPGGVQSSTEVLWERQHVGLTVSTRGEFDRWLETLKEVGIHYELIDNERIYFADPNGLVLELEVESPMPINPAALEVLRNWRGD